MHAKLLQLCLTLCDPMDCSLAGASVRGMLQTRILKWVAMLPDPGIKSLFESSALAGGLFITGVTWEGLDTLNLNVMLGHSRF